MPLGHSYSPRFRVTPPAGNPYVVDVSAYAVVQRAQPIREPLAIIKETINRGLRRVSYGFRLKADLVFVFITPSTDETDFAQRVVTPAAAQETGVEGWKIELALDGAAALPTWREVLLEDYVETPPEEKNIGVVVSSLWACTEPVPVKTAVGSGSW